MITRISEYMEFSKDILEWRNVKNECLIMMGAFPFVDFPYDHGYHVIVLAVTTNLSVLWSTRKAH
jgi:hypothetical protein